MVRDPVELLETSASRREQLAEVYGRRAKQFARQAKEMRQTADELRRLSDKEEHDGNRG
jgi:hypothetical protein